MLVPWIFFLLCAFSIDLTYSHNWSSYLSLWPSNLYHLPQIFLLGFRSTIQLLTEHFHLDIYQSFHMQHIHIWTYLYPHISNLFFCVPCPNKCHHCLILQFIIWMSSLIPPSLSSPTLSGWFYSPNKSSICQFLLFFSSMEWNDLFLLLNILLFCIEV